MEEDATLHIFARGRLPADSLWQSPGFRRFLAVRSVPLLGSQTTALALPLTAVIFLNALAIIEMGVPQTASNDCLGNGSRWLGLSGDPALARAWTSHSG